jgi:hypothetical protein
VQGKPRPEQDQIGNCRGGPSRSAATRGGSGLIAQTNDRARASGRQNPAYSPGVPAVRPVENGRDGDGHDEDEGMDDGRRGRCGAGGAAGVAAGVRLRGAGAAGTLAAGAGDASPVEAFRWPLVDAGKWNVFRSGAPAAPAPAARWRRGTGWRAFSWSCPTPGGPGPKTAAPSSTICRPSGRSGAGGGVDRSGAGEARGERPRGAVRRRREETLVLAASTLPGRGPAPPARRPRRRPRSSRPTGSATASAKRAGKSAGRRFGLLSGDDGQPRAAGGAVHGHGADRDAEGKVAATA